jgi:hypothetical protein
VHVDPGLDLLKKCSFRDLAEPIRGRQPTRLKVGKVQVQITDRVRIDVTVPADAFDSIADIGLRLLTAQEQCRPRLDNAPQPIRQARRPPRPTAAPPFLSCRRPHCLNTA